VATIYCQIAVFSSMANALGFVPFQPTHECFT